MLVSPELLSPVLKFIILASFLVLEKGRYVLFNNTPNTFYLCLYGVRHMVRYHRV